MGAQSVVSGRTRSSIPGTLAQRSHENPKPHSKSEVETTQTPPSCRALGGLQKSPLQCLLTGITVSWGFARSIFMAFYNDPRPDPEKPSDQGLTRPCHRPILQMRTLKPGEEGGVDGTRRPGCKTQGLDDSDIVGAVTSVPCSMGTLFSVATRDSPKALSLSWTTLHSGLQWVLRGLTTFKDGVIRGQKGSSWETRVSVLQMKCSVLEFCCPGRQHSLPNCWRSD